MLGRDAADSHAVADRFQGLDCYTWQPYPQNVPAARRMPCIRCGAPAPGTRCAAQAEVVRYRHAEISGPCTAFASFGNSTASLFTPYCMDCAHNAGYGTYKERGIEPPRLNGLQRWLAHVLDSGDPQPLA